MSKSARNSKPPSTRLCDIRVVLYRGQDEDLLHYLEEDGKRYQRNMTRETLFLLREAMEMRLKGEAAE